VSLEKPSAPTKPEPILSKVEYDALTEKRFLNKKEFEIYKLGYKEDTVEAPAAPAIAPAPTPPPTAPTPPPA